MARGDRKGRDGMDQAGSGKGHRLGERQDREIRDPNGQAKAVFAEVVKNIEDGVADWVERLVA